VYFFVIEMSYEDIWIETYTNFIFDKLTENALFLLYSLLLADILQEKVQPARSMVFQPAHLT